MTSPGSRAHALFIVALVAIVVGLTAATLIVLGTTSETVTCPSFPSCLSSPATWIGAIHEIAAGLLLLLTIGMIVLALSLRRSPGHALAASIAAFFVLIAMASLGAGLAAGVIPLALSWIQFVVLALLLIVIGWAARDARRIDCARYVVRGSPSP